MARLTADRTIFTPRAESETGAFDPITAEVMSMAMRSIANEMGITVERTSGSPITTDSKDYSCLVARADGGCVAYYGNNLQHLGSSLLGTMAVLDRFPIDEIGPGDVFVYNDPATTGALHQCDVAVQAPLFHDGKLVAWIFSNTHHADIGGMTPGGFAPESRDIYAEGLRLPPVKIMQDGEPNTVFWDVVAFNVRTPLVLGDLRSQLAAVNVGKERLTEVLDEYGAEEWRRYVGVNEALVNRLLQDRISKIPPGKYQAEDWVEYDAFDGELYVHIRCELEVTTEGRLIFDFAGSGPQVPGYANASDGAMLGAVLPIVLAALLPDHPVNAGLYERVAVRLGDEGEITNPIPPAGMCGGHIDTGPRAMRAAHTALMRAIQFSTDPWVRGRSYALGGVTTGTTIIAAQTGKGQYGLAFNQDQICLGHGALCTGDGVAFGGIDYSIAGRSADVEVAERSGPIIYLWRKEVTDSGGAGAHRGGNSLEAVYAPWKCTDPVLSGLGAGGVVPTPGTRGGYPGSTLFAEVYPDGLPAEAGTLPDSMRGDKTIIHSQLAAKEIGVRDIIRYVITGGSGWGDPLLRPVEAVRNDLADSAISEQAATAVFGVVFGDDGAIDEAGTQARRHAVRTERLGWREPEAIVDPTPREVLVVGSDGVACAYCAAVLSTDGQVRDLADLNLFENGFSLAERLGSWNVQLVPAEGFGLVERGCPSCGTLVDVTTTRAGDDVVADD